MNNKILALKIAGEWLHNSQFVLAGTKIVNNHMFIKGADYGFPYALGYCEVNLNTNKIVAYYNPRNCPIEIEDGVFE